MPLDEYGRQSNQVLTSYLLKRHRFSSMIFLPDEANVSAIVPLVNIVVKDIQGDGVTNLDVAPIVDVLSKYDNVGALNFILQRWEQLVEKNNWYSKGVGFEARLS